MEKESKERPDLDKKREEGKLPPRITNIEIRDRETRSFTEVRPSWWLRHGTAVITLLFLIIAAIVLATPYPHSGGRTLWEILLP